MTIISTIVLSMTMYCSSGGHKRACMIKHMKCMERMAKCGTSDEMPLIRYRMCIESPKRRCGDK